MDDLYGRTGLSGKAGLSRLEELLNSGAVGPPEASSMLDTMRGQSDFTGFLPSSPVAGGTTLPGPVAPLPAPAALPGGMIPGAKGPGGNIGHGTIVTQLMAQMMGGGGGIRSDPQYQAGRQLGELLRNRRG